VTAFLVVAFTADARTATGSPGSDPLPLLSAHCGSDAPPGAEVRPDRKAGQVEDDHCVALALLNDSGHGLRLR
jgi:hypothetical protein